MVSTRACIGEHAQYVNAGTAYTRTEHLRAAALEVHTQHIVCRRHALALRSLRGADNPQSLPAHCSHAATGDEPDGGGPGAAEHREGADSVGPKRGQAHEQLQDPC